MSISIGDYVKNTVDGRVFKVVGFAGGNKHIPDGFYIDRNGTYANPRFCVKYEGALSAIPEAQDDIDCGYRME